MVALIIPDAKGTNAEFNIFFLCENTVGYAFDQLIDVIAPPVVDGAETVSILPKLFCIGDGVFLWIGVKVVVKMDTVYIVVSYHIHDDRGYLGSNFGQCRVEVFLSAVGKKPFRFFTGNMVRSDIARRIERCAIWIHPGMQLHSARMGFFDGKIERIINRTG